MIHLDTPVCEWHWQQLSLSDDMSVAVFHVPFPYDNSFQIKIDRAVDDYDTVIILCSELHDSSVNFIQQYQNSKIHYYTCGFINNIVGQLWMDWFITTVDVYKRNPPKLDPYSIKPKYFDALLGWAKPHRQLVYDQLGSDDRVITSYLQDRSRSLTDSGWINASQCNMPLNVKNTVTQINYQGQSASISQIIPDTVYNQTAYSIVAETNYSNHYSFYTEKIVKPILAERLFVVFSGQHYLKNLRRLGFKTFSNIIDEDYDTVADPIRRFNLALAQVEYLLNQPQEAILSQIKPITEHNQQLMLDYDWLGSLHNDIKNKVTR